MTEELALSIKEVLVEVNIKQLLYLADKMWCNRSITLCIFQLTLKYSNIKDDA